MIALLTGTGLAAAAGLNAYIPFLIVALVARFTDYLELPSQYAWIESWWSIAIASVLLISELVLDKIPIVDHINDTVATFIRPTVGGLIFVATTAAQQLDESTWMQENQWLPALLGVVVAGIVHVTKAAARPVVNITTVGTGAPVVSAAEDGTSVLLSLLALFAPLLVLVALVLLAWGIIVVWRARRRRRNARAALADPRAGTAPAAPDRSPSEATHD